MVWSNQKCLFLQYNFFKYQRSDYDDRKVVLLNINMTGEDFSTLHLVFNLTPRYCHFKNVLYIFYKKIAKPPENNLYFLLDLIIQIFKKYQKKIL